MRISESYLQSLVPLGGEESEFATLKPVALVDADHLKFIFHWWTGLPRSNEHQLLAQTLRAAHYEPPLALVPDWRAIGVALLLLDQLFVTEISREFLVIIELA